MNLKLLTITAITSAIIGAIVAYKLLPQKIKTVEKEVIKDKIVTVTKTVKGVDGSVTIVETKNEDKIVQKDVVKEAPTAHQTPKWNVGVGRTIDGVYFGDITRNIIGPIYLGVAGTSTGQMGAVVRITF